MFKQFAYWLKKRRDRRLFQNFRDAMRSEGFVLAINPCELSNPRFIALEYPKYSMGTMVYIDFASKNVSEIIDILREKIKDWKEFAAEHYNY